MFNTDYSGIIANGTGTLIDSLLEVTTPTTAGMLEKLISSKGVIEVSRADAFKRGFEELADWSIPENDRLYVIGDFILICLPKDGGPYA